MNRICYRTARVSGRDIFYRKAGPQDAPTILLLQQLYDLITHIPQYPGCGESLNREESRNSVRPEI
jgi:hypothetical protein